MQVGRTLNLSSSQRAILLSARSYLAAKYDRCASHPSPRRFIPPQHLFRAQHTRWPQWTDAPLLHTAATLGGAQLIGGAKVYWCTAPHLGLCAVISAMTGQRSVLSRNAALGWAGCMWSGST